MYIGNNERDRGYAAYLKKDINLTQLVKTNFNTTVNLTQRVTWHKLVNQV